jgi:hypothetical protein
MRVTTASRMSSMPMPDLPLARMASSAGIMRMSSSCCVQRSRLAEGRSILLMTGIILRPWAVARWALATVCASTPWAASMRSTAPSQAASERETS